MKITYLIIMCILMVSLVGCYIDYETDPQYQYLKGEYDKCSSATGTYINQLSDWEHNGLKAEDLHKEAMDWCVLITVENNTDWSEPSHWKYKNIVPLRTLTLETDQINPPDIDEFKYWLACDVTYR